jgi:hypothetical protein
MEHKNSPSYHLIVTMSIYNFCLRRNKAGSTLFSTFIGKNRATVWLTGGGENEILDPFPEPFTRPKRLALIVNI